MVHLNNTTHMKLWRLPYSTHCIQLTTHSLLKYHWRREVLNQFGIVKIMLYKLYLCFNNKITTFCFGQDYIYFYIYIFHLATPVVRIIYSGHNSILDYISQNFTVHNYGIMVRELCFTEIHVIHMYLVQLKLFNSCNTYVRYKNIYSNVHLTSLYLFCF